LVAGWPPEPSAIDGPYTEFLESVKACFDKLDLEATTTISNENDSISIPAVYFYPSIHLHLTLATFSPAERTSSHHLRSPQEFVEFKTTYTRLVQEASKQHDWPKAPIQLVMKSTQLGSKAGIILWEDISGTVQRIRGCLQQVAARRDLNIFAIPGIIHSTFLRFSQVPTTTGHLIQERYQKIVVPHIQKVFLEPIVATTIKLVVESTPYMHIPDDEEHCLLTVTLGDDTSSSCKG